MMWKQYKRKLILLIIAGTMLLAAGVYAGFKLGRSGNNSNLAIDPNAVPIDEAYLASQHYNPSTAVQGSFIHHLFTDLYFTVGSTTQELPVWNDLENPYNLMVTLYLEDEEEPLAENSLKAEQVLKIMQGLKPNYKVILTLFFIEGYDLEEISGILNISNENCRTTMSRAKESLRKKANEYGA